MLDISSLATAMTMANGNGNGNGNVISYNETDSVDYDLWWWHIPYTIFTIMNVSNLEVQSNLVISNSLISNYRLSRSENLVPVLTWNCDNR